MAATVQSQQANPQLKRLVYSKYRELLGSYNDKANSIIQSLPSYMVTEDKGFHFENNNGNDSTDENDKSNYGTPPAPPSLSGSIPSRKLPSNIPVSSDPPACVQNAMMTKDKKPFTYTPGGIDLSQIKSPRMAKRIARNAQYEGVTGPVKPSPLAQSNKTQQSSPAVPSYGAQAVGMPVQVFPNGPPPPPPAPSSGAIPPPPPLQANRNQLAPQTNGVDTRRSPTPQNFEPPPLGCRPEIKIPPNPMASLKRVPRPREKNDFWIEEYRKERSVSPMVNNNGADSGNNYQQPEQNDPHSFSATNNQPEPAVVKQQTQSPTYMQQQVRSSSPIKQYIQSQQQNSPEYSQQNQFQQNRVDSPLKSHDNTTSPRPPSPAKVNYQPEIQIQQQQRQAPIHMRSQSQPQSMNSPPLQQQQQQQQKNSQVGSLYIPPVPEENLSIKRQQQSQQKQSPPLQQHLQQQQQQRLIQASNSPTPRWMTQKKETKEIPEWVKDDANPQSSTIRHVQAPESPSPHQTPSSTSHPQSPVHHVQAPQTFVSNNTSNASGPGLRIQITPKSASNLKERIIPIQIEQTPTPTRTPGTAGFGPQPFYNSNQQYNNNVTSPSTGYSSPNSGYNVPSQTSGARHPNQFVDQGYNTIPSRWATQHRVTSPPAQQSPPPSSASSTTSSGTRIIPIAIEGQDQGPFNPNSVRGPTLSSPLVIQNDPRTLQHQNSWGGNGQPNQSKSFRILQKLTDTEDDKDSNSDQSSVQYQRPQYARHMSSVSSSNGNDSPTDQMRRMQLKDSDQAFMNRVKNQVEEDKFLHNEEDPRYRGSAIPSKSFKLLQNMIGEKTDDTNQVPVQRPQQPRYMQQRSDYQQNDQPQQYIHPSEQQVPEPKKYTGSAIPSRSFKILQAMTTPENAAEMEGSDVEYEQISPFQLPYPSPYPPYWLPPPPPFYPPLDTNKWPHQPYPPPHPYFYPYYHPDYDSQNFCNGYYPPFYGPYTGNYQIPLINKKMKTPNIIITSSSDDEKQINNNDSRILDSSDKKEDEILKRNKREGSAIDVLSKRLSEISNPDIDLNISKDDKMYVGDCSKEIQNEDNQQIALSPVGTEKSSEIENGSDVIDSCDEETDSSSDDSSSSGIKKKNKTELDGDRLQAIKSVTDINVYDTEESDREINKNKNINYKKLSEMIFGKRSDDEEEDDSRDQTSTIEADSSISSCSACFKHEHDVDNQNDDSGSDSDEVEEFTEDTEDIEMQQMLSIIYEESELDDKERVVSQASTIMSESDCSTTIANDDNIYDNNDNDKHQPESNGVQNENENINKIIDDDDENSSLVTVRLPLKLSFSRSSNDENITTVIVGDSEIEDEKSISSSVSKKYEEVEDNEEADVSVTINLPSRRSSSVDCRNFNKKNTLSFQDDDSDSEISVSVSLPMKRDKFMEKTLSGDVTNNISCIFASKSDNKLNEYERTNMIEEMDVVENKDNDGNRNKKFMKSYSIHTEDEAEDLEDDKETEAKDEGKINIREFEENKLEEKHERKKEEEIEYLEDRRSYNNILEEKLNKKDEVERCDLYSNLQQQVNQSEDVKIKRSFEEEHCEKVNNNDTIREEKIDIEHKNRLNEIKDEVVEEAEAEGEEEMEIEEEIEEEEDEEETEEEIEEEVEEEIEEEVETEDENENEKPKEIDEKNPIEIEDEEKDSPSDLTPTNLYPSKESTLYNFKIGKEKEMLNSDYRNNQNMFDNDNEIKVSVRDRIAAFESTTDVNKSRRKSTDLLEISPKETLSRNSSLQKSESEIEEEDSGVTSDLSKRISETDTESEGFPELRKMTRYQRAATHSRLFKLLQEESLSEEKEKDEDVDKKEEQQSEETFTLRPRKKIVHNVSITRKTNPELIKDAETMSERRERLSLPLKMSTSIDADNPSTSNSPSSPTNSYPVISDKLVNELVQSLLLKKNSHHLKNLSMEKLQAAARKVLQESFDSLENTSLDSTPALTPQEFKTEINHPYADYYESWNAKNTSNKNNQEDESIEFDILPSKAFRTLQEQSLTGKRKLWAARCPRVLSSKTINRDLAKVTEIREPESPERYRSCSVAPQSSNNTINENSNIEFKRGASLSRLNDV